MTLSFPPGVHPYGVFSMEDERRRLGAAVGDEIADLDAAASSGAIDSVDPASLTTGRLDEHLAAGPRAWVDLREEVVELAARGELEEHVVSSNAATHHLAWTVADYVDFYASRHHASNVGAMFRPDSEPLLPNWEHMPVGYHGRSGTVLVDDTPVQRPLGQREENDGSVVFGPSTRLDFELELGFVLGGRTDLGEPVPIERAENHLFGVVLLNDWSARDIQAWEYKPLGPFLGKSFATTVSAWVMPVDLLPRSTPPERPEDAPTLLPHLVWEDDWTLDLTLGAWLRPVVEDEPTQITSVRTSAGLSWTPSQMIAHLTSNGAGIRPGDLIGSGTVSGPSPGERGCLLELTWGGREPLQIGASQRTFLHDGDEVVLSGSGNGVPLGPVSGTILPALDQER